MNSLDRLQPIALLVLRAVLGAILIAHGYHKVFGGFGPHQQSVMKLGMPGWMAYLSAGTEFFGGIGLILGLFTRCFATAVLIEMVIVILKVHLKNGLTGAGGFEFPLALAAMAFALVCMGGGPFGFNFGAGGSPRRPKKS